MAKSKAREAIPVGGTVQEMIEFFDTHDMGDYWDDLPDAQFDVDLETKRHMVEIDKEILIRLAQIAHAKRMTSKALINSWLLEKIGETTYQSSKTGTSR